METIILLLVVSFIVYMFVQRSEKNKEYSQAQNKKPSEEAVRDEMAGNSVTAFFLLEEFVDRPQQNERSKNMNVGADDWHEQEVEESEWCEEEFFE